MISDGFAIVYDLRDPSAWCRAHAHRRLWGHRFTDYYVLDQDHILMVFRPGSERWRPWERHRLQLILGEAACRRSPRGARAAPGPGRALGR